TTRAEGLEPLRPCSFSSFVGPFAFPSERKLCLRRGLNRTVIAARRHLFPGEPAMLAVAPVAPSVLLAAGSATVEELELSVVMPCLNEQRTVGVCVEKALRTMRQLGINGEVVVVDNGSTDDSVAVARQAGARVVHQSLKGYGNALKKGFAEAHAKFIL